MSAAAWPSSYHRRRTRKELPVNSPPAGSRMALWIDGVGAYLACLGEQVTLGQALPTNSVEVPILSDIARRHCVISRTGESYMLVPEGKVTLGGRVLSGASVLCAGDEFTLNQSVRLRFRRPHPLSATARLDMLSRHRTQPLADAILLVADTIVLGPRLANHVLCRDWSADVVLFREGAKWWCRSSAPLEIDGVLYDTCGPLGANSRVTGCDFSFSLEWLT